MAAPLSSKAAFLSSKEHAVRSVRSMDGTQARWPSMGCGIRSSGGNGDGHKWARTESRLAAAAAATTATRAGPSLLCGAALRTHSLTQSTCARAQSLFTCLRPYLPHLERLRFSEFFLPFSISETTIQRAPSPSSRPTHATAHLLGGSCWRADKLACLRANLTLRRDSLRVPVSHFPQL